MYPGNLSNPSAAASFDLASLPIAEVSPPASAVDKFPRNAQHSHLLHRPNRGPHGAPVKRSRFLGPCSVYLLVHQHDRRFKIGLSQEVIGRLPGGHDVVAQWRALCQRLT